MRNEAIFPDRKVKRIGKRSFMHYAGILSALFLCFWLAGCGEEKATAEKPSAAEKAAPTVTELLPDAANLRKSILNAIFGRSVQQFSRTVLL